MIFGDTFSGRDTRISPSRDRLRNSFSAHSEDELDCVADPAFGFGAPGPRSVNDGEKNGLEIRRLCVGGANEFRLPS